jgi:4-alpha-glucanotransferase
MARLREAEAGFRARAGAADQAAFAAYCAAQAHWLDDYALFMALDDAYRAREVWSWTGWDPALAAASPRPWPRPAAPMPPRSPSGSSCSGSSPSNGRR